MHLLYPSNPLRTTLPDEQFTAELEAVSAVGLKVSVFSIENFQAGEFRPLPALPAGTEVLYRGWMMSASEYETFVSNLGNIGARPATSKEDYLTSHHLPNWYPLISDLTPETRVFPKDCDLESELRGLAWPEYFINDYVKSLKTSVGSRVSKPEQASTVVTEMKRFRGRIEGGFCIRRVEDFVPDTERRYFILDGVPHAASGQVPSIVLEFAKRLQNWFYSVDVVQRTDGQLRVVEVGDGQVSDLVGWRPKKFAEVLREHFYGKP